MPRDREAFLAALCALPGAPAPRIGAFFAQQRQIADTLWALFDDPALLPPFSPSMLLRHLARAPRYAKLLPLLGRPLGALLERHGLAGFTPLRTWLDAVCQITVQCSADEAESSFALAAIDYFWRGTGHVRGGIGMLARGLCEALEQLGAQVRFGDRVRSLRRQEDHWLLETRRGPLRARAVVANLLPHDLRALLGEVAGCRPGLDALGDRVAGGWGAAMLYRVARAPVGAGGAPQHLQLIRDAALPLQEGNHVFLSISGAADEGRAPPGLRTLTASTHVPLALLRGPPAEQAARVAEVQAAMRATLDARALEWSAGLEHELTASPRTFARFTRRSDGAVGGVPRRAGLGHYWQLGPIEVASGLWLAGDSAFPGQSTLATALGGVRVAEAISRAG